jgi:2'-hydroxyisoflavone reductase
VKLLVLGGSHFVGLALVIAAQARGHQATVFNRGRSSPSELAGVEQLRGDRNGDLAALRGREWDAVVDTCGFFPEQIHGACEALRGRAGQYAFFSTAAVYRPDAPPPLTERSPLRRLTSATPDFARDYGALKVACERELERSLAFRPLIVRPGLIAGPGDHTDRFTYWPRRIKAGGDILVPGPPSRRIQILDVRDLVVWMLRMLERGVSGTFNTGGQSRRISEVLDACARVTAKDPRLVWVDEQFLVDEGVRPWTELPLWIRDPGTISVTSLDSGAAHAEGLRLRPLEDTIRDTLAWDDARPRPLPRGRTGTKYVVETLEREREAELLESWRRRLGGGHSARPTHTA